MYAKPPSVINARKSSIVRTSNQSNSSPQRRGEYQGGRVGIILQ